MFNSVTKISTNSKRIKQEKKEENDEDEPPTRVTRKKTRVNYDINIYNNIYNFESKASSCSNSSRTKIKKEIASGRDGEVKVNANSYPNHQPNTSNNTTFRKVWDINDKKRLIQIVPMYKSERGAISWLDIVREHYPHYNAVQIKCRYERYLKLLGNDNVVSPMSFVSKLPVRPNVTTHLLQEDSDDDDQYWFTMNITSDEVESALRIDLPDGNYKLFS
eukprot:Pgem_evm1s8518